MVMIREQQRLSHLTQEELLMSIIRSRNPNFKPTKYSEVEIEVNSHSIYVNGIEYVLSPEFASAELRMRPVDSDREDSPLVPSLNLLYRKGLDTRGRRRELQHIKSLTRRKGLDVEYFENPSYSQEGGSNPVITITARTPDTLFNAVYDPHPETADRAVRAKPKKPVLEYRGFKVGQIVDNSDKCKSPWTHGTGKIVSINPRLDKPFTCIHDNKEYHYTAKEIEHADKI